MPESGVSYAGAEPTVLMAGPMPADLYAKLLDYAPAQTGGDAWALVIECVRSRLDPIGAARIEALREGKL